MPDVREKVNSAGLTSYWSIVTNESSAFEFAQFLS